MDLVLPSFPCHVQPIHHGRPSSGMRLLSSLYYSPDPLVERPARSAALPEEGCARQCHSRHHPILLLQALRDFMLLCVMLDFDQIKKL